MDAVALAGKITGIDSILIIPLLTIIFYSFHIVPAGTLDMRVCKSLLPVHKG